MNIFVDIDDTICTRVNKDVLDYSKSTPIPCRIQRINKLYDDGHIITYWTARGTKSGKDWSSVTEEQFKQWGVKYHNLLFNKPAYDIYIDDKSFNSEFFFNNKYLIDL